MASQLTFEKCNSLFSYFHIDFCISFYTSVLTCDILEISFSDFCKVQYLFKTIICSGVKMKKSHKIPLK